MDAAGEPDRAVVYFDGGCGLCHRFVQEVVRADVRGVFRFSPLNGVAWKSESAEAAPVGTVVLRTEDGTRLMRSDAVIAILERLGGTHARRARFMKAVPRPIRDAGYRLVAAVRGFLFPRPEGPCPLLPPELRGRFLP